MQSDPEDTLRATSAYDFDNPYWTLTASLIWIATLDAKRVAADGARTPVDADLRFMIEKRLSDCVGSKPSSAWNLLGSKMAGGEIRAFACRTVRRLTSGIASETTETGLTFPPTDRKGLVLTYVLADDRGDTVVRPAEAPWSTAYEQWSDVQICREDILRHWPAPRIEPAEIRETITDPIIKEAGPKARFDPHEARKLLEAAEMANGYISMKDAVTLWKEHFDIERDAARNEFRQMRPGRKQGPPGPRKKKAVSN